MESLINFQQQFADGAAAAEKSWDSLAPLFANRSFNRFIFCGMGGSIASAEIVSMLWPEINTYIHRAFGLPFWAEPSRSLAICISWSGNTEETISSLHQAIEKEIPAVAIATGGQLAQIATENNIPLITLPNPDQLPPRLGVGRMGATLLTLLFKTGNIRLNPSEATLSNAPPNPLFFARIGAKTPLIYSSYRWRYLANFWKILFNENAKIHAFYNYLPGAVHNEIAGFAQRKENFFPIVIRDAEDDPRDIEKLDKFISFLKEEKIDREVVNLAAPQDKPEEWRRLEKIAANCNAAVANSTALAKALGQDPLDIAIIEKFKKIS